MNDAIEINGERYTFIIVHPNNIITGQDKLYLFWGVDWKQIDKPIAGNEIITFKYPVRHGRVYNAKVIDKSEISSNDPSIRYIFWNNNWYELTIKS